MAKTKYDCPFFNPRGGHCERQCSNGERYIHRLGCSRPDDIDSCELNQTAFQCAHYDNFSCHRKCGESPTCTLLNHKQCMFFERAK